MLTSCIFIGAMICLIKRDLQEYGKMENLKCLIAMQCNVS